jgi:hypothetical protein
MTHDGITHLSGCKGRTPSLFLTCVRFKLITMFMMVAVLSIPMQCVSQRLASKRRERTAASSIRRSQGSVRLASDVGTNYPLKTVPKWLVPLLGEDFFDPVVGVVYAPKIKNLDGSFPILGSFPRLEHLVLRGPAISDDDLRSLQVTRNVRWLYVNDALVSDVGLAFARHCFQLEFLDASRTSVTGRGLGVLIKNEVDDEGAMTVSRFQQLKYLSLYGTPITDYGISRFAQNKLVVLSLGGTGISGPGLDGLRSCAALHTLELHHTRIDDASIPYLARLTQLANLNLTGTAITDAGLAQLRRSLPNCNIDH